MTAATAITGPETGRQLPPAQPPGTRTRTSDGEWEIAEVLRPDGGSGLVMVRHTTGWVAAVDRKVAEAGHGEHGGWYISPGKIVTCGRVLPPWCEEPLFPLIDVTHDPADTPPGVT